MKGIVGWFVGLVLIGGSAFGGLQAYKSASGELAYHKTLSEEKIAFCTKGCWCRVVRRRDLRQGNRHSLDQVLQRPTLVGQSASRFKTSSVSTRVVPKKLQPIA